MEATAELRHREVLTQAQARAEALHKAKTEELVEALRVREGIKSQRARDASMSNEDEMKRMGTCLRESFKHEAQEHVRLQEAQMKEKIHAYQMVIDANHRQSLSSKEQVHDHFSTNIKHGATYALQDLFSVQLLGKNLKSFIWNWDQVLAGTAQAPEESVLETLFYKQAKNSKAIQHDMNEYHRADEGTDKRMYDFLVSAVRHHLDRERLEANRDRVAKGLSGAAVEGKAGFIPKEYCVAWNKGCTKDDSAYKHEIPKPALQKFVLHVWPAPFQTGMKGQIV